MLSRHFLVTSLAFLSTFLVLPWYIFITLLVFLRCFFGIFLTHPRYCFSISLTLHWCFFSTPLIECEPLFHQSYTPLVCFLKKHCFLSRYVCCTYITAYAQPFCHFHAPVVCFFAKATCLLSNTSSTFSKGRVFASRARIRALSSFFRIFPIFRKTHTGSHLFSENSHRCRHFAYKPHLFMPHLKKAKKEQEYKVNHYHIAWCP